MRAQKNVQPKPDLPLPNRWGNRAGAIVTRNLPVGEAGVRYVCGGISELGPIGQAVGLRTEANFKFLLYAELAGKTGIQIKHLGARRMLLPLVPNRTAVTGANAFGSSTVLPARGHLKSPDC